jgi:cell division septal protein FtsQ
MKDEDSGEILLPDKLDVEETSPYPRRPRAVSARRGVIWRNKGKIALWSVVGLAVMIPLAYFSFRLGQFTRSSERFNVTSPNDVTIEGNRYATSDEIMNALGLPPPGSKVTANVFVLSLDEMRNRVEAIPWVKLATVTRAFPHRIQVRVIEGVILEKPERGDFTFPVITGLDAASDDADRRSRIAKFQELMKQLSQDSSPTGWLVSEVDLSDADDLKAVLVQGDESILVHFGHEQFGERFHDFLSLVPEMHKTNQKIGSVDLRYRNQVVVSSPSASGNGAAHSGTPKE